MFFRKKQAQRPVFVGLVVLHSRCGETFAPAEEDVVGPVTGDAETAAALEILAVASDARWVEARARDQFLERYGAWSVLDVLLSEVIDPSPALRLATRNLAEDWDGDLRPLAVPTIVGKTPEEHRQALAWIARTWSRNLPERDDIWYLEGQAQPVIEGPRSANAEPAATHMGCWVRTHDAEQALWIARRLLRQEGWMLCEVRDSVPAERAGQTPQFMRQYDEAMKLGVSLALLSGPGGYNSLLDLGKCVAEAA